jgi:hypothetical protein
MSLDAKMQLLGDQTMNGYVLALTAGRCAGPAAGEPIDGRGAAPPLTLAAMRRDIRDSTGA